MPKKKLFKWEIFIDGASRGNPGPAGAGIYIKLDTQDILKKSFYLGTKTNNQAEYIALVLAIFIFKKTAQEFSTSLDDHNIVVFSDSELLVKQMNGEYKIKNPILSQIKNLIDSKIDDLNIKFSHVLRSLNKTADKLANLGIDQKKPIPQSLQDILTKVGVAE